jgi:hypothetical protein
VRALSQCGRGPPSLPHAVAIFPVEVFSSSTVAIGVSSHYHCGLFSIATMTHVVFAPFHFASFLLLFMPRTLPAFQNDDLLLFSLLSLLPIIIIVVH